MKSYCYYCSWQDCVLSMSIVSLHSKNVALAKKSQRLLLHTFPKKAMICRQTAVPTSLRAGGSHLIQSHQKSVALGTCHSFEAEWEMVTLSQKWEGKVRRWDALHIKVGVFHVQRVGPNFQEAPAPAPSKTYQVAGWLFFFKIQVKKIYMPCNMRQFVCVCVFFLLSQCVFRQNSIHEHIWQVEPLKNKKIKNKKRKTQTLIFWHSIKSH